MKRADRTKFKQERLKSLRKLQREFFEFKTTVERLRNLALGVDFLNQDLQNSFVDLRKFFRTEIKKVERSLKNESSR